MPRADGLGDLTGQLRPLLGTLTGVGLLLVVLAGPVPGPRLLDEIVHPASGFPGPIAALVIVLVRTAALTDELRQCLPRAVLVVDVVRRLGQATAGFLLAALALGPRLARPVRQLANYAP
jgi:hypothetical protein